MFFHLRSGQLKSRFLSACEAVLEALKRIIPANRQIIAPSCISTIFGSCRSVSSLYRRIRTHVFHFRSGQQKKKQVCV